MPILTDEDWALLEPLMPPRSGARGGRPWSDHRLTGRGDRVAVSDRLPVA